MNPEDSLDERIAALKDRWSEIRRAPRQTAESREALRQLDKEIQLLEAEREVAMRRSGNEVEHVGPSQSRRTARSPGQRDSEFMKPLGRALGESEGTLRVEVPGESSTRLEARQWRAWIIPNTRWLVAIAGDILLSTRIVVRDLSLIARRCKAWSSAVIGRSKMLNTAGTRWLVATILAGLVLAAIIVLELWETPPDELVELRQTTVATLHWLHELWTKMIAIFQRQPNQRWLIAIATLIFIATWLIGHISLEMVFGATDFVFRTMLRFNAWLDFLNPLVSAEVLEEQRQRRRRAHSRAMMIRRVHRKWIDSNLGRSLIQIAGTQLGFPEWETSRRLQTIAIRPLGREARFVPVRVTISEVFDLLEGKVVILGEPGSGKSTVLLQLGRDLINRATIDSAQPIPVLLDFSSWAVRPRPLAEWLIDELEDGYGVQREIAQAWVDDDELVLLLDGLDDLHEKLRMLCMTVIRYFRDEHSNVQLAICGRSEAYPEVARHFRVAEVDPAGLLRLGEAMLQPPPMQEVDYLLRMAGGPLADVRAALRADSSLAELLSSPLMIGLVALTDQQRRATALRTAGTLASRRALLLGAYVERIVDQLGRFYYRKTKIVQWFAWIAQTMQDNGQNSFCVDRLLLAVLPTRKQQQIVVYAPAIVTGIIFWLSGTLPIILWLGLPWDLCGALALGLIVVLVLRNWTKGGRIKPVEASYLSALLIGLLSLGAGLELSNSFGSDPNADLTKIENELTIGLFLLLLVGLVAHLAVRIGVIWVLVRHYRREERGELSDERVSSRDGVIKIGLEALVAGVGIGLGIGLAWPSVGPPALGWCVALLYAQYHALENGGFTCLQRLTFRSLLARNDVAPFCYIRFLNRATDLHLLRKTESGYVFFHEQLRDYFARLDRVGPSPSTAGSGSSFTDDNRRQRDAGDGPGGGLPVALQVGQQPRQAGDRKRHRRRRERQHRRQHRQRHRR